MRVRIRPSTLLVEHDGATLAIQTSTRVVQKLRLDELALAIIDQLASPRDEQEIFAALSAEHDPATIRACLDALKSVQVISEQLPESVPAAYRRQIAFLAELSSSPQEAYDRQQKILGSTVTVVGAGGIGSWIVNGLAQIGVGAIRVIDADTVEETNLNRQLLYTRADVGKYKVDVLMDRIPDASIIPHKEFVSPESNLERLLGGSTFVINCADHPSVQETTRLIDSFARPNAIPYIAAGGYNLHLGMVGPVIIPGETACFDCFLSYQKANDPLKDARVIHAIEEPGNLGPIAGAIANIHVMEAFKYLSGVGSINRNRFAEIDFLNLHIDWREFARNPECETCSGAKTEDIRAR